jgi:hypothetical protein
MSAVDRQSWTLNNPDFTGWNFNENVMYRAQLVWDTNSLQWVKSTGGTGPGSNVSVTNFPNVQKVTSGFSVPAYDYVALTQGATTDAWAFYLGGAGGTLLNTITLNYTDVTKATIANVVKT